MFLLSTFFLYLISTLQKSTKTISLWLLECSDFCGTKCKSSCAAASESTKENKMSHITSVLLHCSSNIKCTLTNSHSPRMNGLKRKNKFIQNLHPVIIFF